MNKITDANEFIKIVGILSNSDISDENCIYITNFIVNLNKQLEEKDKIINEAKEYLIKLGKQPDADLYYCINEHKEYTELLEILKRGKNGK